jgi:HK97 family phage portal protein
LSESKRLPLLHRVTKALRVLTDREDEKRVIVPTTYPNYPAGTQQMQLVRTADPTEYRRDGKTVRIQGFNAHPVVHACIRVIADIMASVPLVVLADRGDYESKVGEEHPLQQLLDYPGPRFTARQFRARFAVDFLGYGNAFFVMERTSPNRPPQFLRPVNPESMQQVWIDPEGDPRRYDYANWAGIMVNVLTEDMLHFRDLEMGRPFEADVFGYPRGATAIASVLADNEATQYVRQVVTNDGTPTFAVIMSDEATADDALAMQERYSARVVDRGKRGKPAFFGSVKDIKPIGFTLNDLEFPDLRRISREDICAAFGVDPRMIGIGSASSDGGLSGIQYAEARARLVQHTIEPMFAAFEDELNHWLAPEFGDVYVCYDKDILRDLVENDIETSERVRAEFQSGLRTWEESRTALKLSPLPEPTDSILRMGGQELIPAALAVLDPRDLLEPRHPHPRQTVPCLPVHLRKTRARPRMKTRMLWKTRHPTRPLSTRNPRMRKPMRKWKPPRTKPKRPMSRKKKQPTMRRRRRKPTRNSGPSLPSAWPSSSIGNAPCKSLTQ